MPSQHQRSGRLLSCSSIRNSPVSKLWPFNSPLTKESHSSNCSTVIDRRASPAFDKSASKSCFKIEIVGIRSLVRCLNSILAPEHGCKLDNYTQTETRPGCSKRPLFSPAQPRRAKTRTSAGEAAASDEATRTLLCTLSLQAM